jgi:hypothetical protein
MSNKKDILIVGVLSAALFTGFTAYTQVAGKGKTATVPTKNSASSVVTSPSKALPRNTADSQVAPPADPAPTNTTRTKNTKTKAS